MSKFKLRNTGVIPEADYAESNPVRQLCMEILGGRTIPFSRKEIERIVDRRYFDFDSLVSLTQREESFLRDDITNDLLNRFNKGKMRMFLGSNCYQSTYLNCFGTLNIYTEEVGKKEIGFSHFHLMTNEEKLSFLENPKNLNARWNERGSETSFARMGYRTIDKYPFPLFAKSFTDAVRQLQTDIGKKELHVLDLGGGVGLGLHDVKKMHPELITYNATCDEEFCHYPTDFHIVGFAERMPLALQGKIDFIFSNMATRYFAFADLVMKCCVQMLGKGGVMSVFFSSESSINRDEEDVKFRMREAHDFLRELEKAGSIQLKINNRFYGLGPCKAEKGSLYPASSVFVKKL